MSAQFVVVPGGASGSEANNGEIDVLGNDNASADIRIQQVYSSTLLSGLIGQQITGISFRLDNTQTQTPFSSDFTFSEYDIYLGQSAHSPDTVDTTDFANNRGSGFVQVRSGSMTIHPGDYTAGNNPNSFGTTISVTPFTYQGGDLIVEIAYHSPSINSSRNVDAADNAGTGATVIYGQFNGAVDGSSAGEAIVMGFQVSAVPEPAWSAVAAGGLLLGFVVVRKMKSKAVA